MPIGASAISGILAVVTALAMLETQSKPSSIKAVTDILQTYLIDL